MLSLGICRSGDLSKSPSRDEEPDDHNAISLHIDTLREDALE